MRSPTLIQAGERKLVCFIQPENRDKLLYAESNDFGETWSSAMETEIPSGIGGIESIRLRDSNGIYTPTVVLVYAQKKSKVKFSIMLAISSDIGESWDEYVEIEEIDSPYSNISLMQTDDNKLHVVYCSKQGIKHLVVNDFVIF
jgi:predicted neuraminidase